ncbi:MAG TPA: S9 family peptidase [Pirellulales bacterium]|jgi:acylaminoacyl-peptidase|nr:S9 family peptidase [Pirellulales bacterium]
MTRLTFCVILGFGFCHIFFVASLPRSVAGDRATLQPLDVFQLEYASDPRISPDGRRVAYLRNSMDVMRDRVRSELWIINADGSEHRPLVSGAQNISQPRWSPDGTRIAYVSKTSEEGPAQIFVRWMDSGETARLTQLAEDPGDLSWSPDGRLLAFVMLMPEKPTPYVDMPAKPEGADWADPPRFIRRVLYRHDDQGYLKPGFKHVFTLPAEGGTPRQVTSGDYFRQGPLAWSPDGKAIYFSANRNEDWEYDPRETNIFGVDLADGSLKQLTDRKGPDEHPVVSPDGSRIAWLGYDDEKLSHQTMKLYIMNREGGDRREITNGFDRDVANPDWSRDGRGLCFQFDDTGTTKLGFVTLDGKVSTLAENLGGVTLDRPYASGSYSADGRGHFAFTFSTPDHPADVAVGDQGSSEIRWLTRLNDDLFAQRTLATTEELWFESSADGRRIQGWIVKPPAFDPTKKYPLILEIHGGPFANYGNRFATENQFYAAAGYVVLYANPRGSTGYGEQFCNLIHHKYPAQDYDDLMSGVDAAISQGYVDADNLYVTGGSGGGILTAWIVGKTNRFRAAVAAKPVINWYSFALTSDIYPYFNDYWFPGVPWKNAEHYLRRSPLSLVENVTTPTMLITGEQDYRTPISEAEQFYQALKLRKVDAMLVRVPGASHDITKRPSRLMMKTQYVLKWFSTYQSKP